MYVVYLHIDIANC